MDDLTDGTRVRHVTWGDEGAILVALGGTWVKFDQMSPPTEVCPGGYIEPGDLEIIGGGSR
jgi:hypothetical protein